MGRHFHVDGITVTKTNQTIESASVGATAYISLSPALLFRCLA
jgi:hypothetical protein